MPAFFSNPTLLPLPPFRFSFFFFLFSLCLGVQDDGLIKRGLVSLMGFEGFDRVERVDWV